MLLFEIYERMKVRFEKLNSSKSIKYSFVKSNRERAQKIRELSDIFKEVVADEQKEEVQERFVARVSDIKFVSMQSQYVSLFNTLGINSELWLPRMKKAVEFRNSIFHGGHLDIDDDAFKASIGHLWEIDVILICRFQGLNIESKIGKD
jgi:hypothetical protein